MQLQPQFRHSHSLRREWDLLSLSLSSFNMGILPNWKAGSNFFQHSEGTILPGKVFQYDKKRHCSSNRILDVGVFLLHLLDGALRASSSPPIPSGKGRALNAQIYSLFIYWKIALVVIKFLAQRSRQGTIIPGLQSLGVLFSTAT